jgi:hypothetical protein
MFPDYIAWAELDSISIKLIRYTFVFTRISLLAPFILRSMPKGVLLYNISGFTELAKK